VTNRRILIQMVKVLFFEVESGTNPNRKKFLQLKSEIRTGKWNAMLTMKADTIASDWKQFMDFMEGCEKEASLKFSEIWLTSLLIVKEDRV
jgi:DNA invertase Pin-like site-specific DNA recombinase